MNDDYIDQFVCAADPYDPTAFGDLQGAKQELLEEIMSQPPVKQLIPRGRRRVLFASVTLVAAAALTVALAAPTLLSHDNETPHVATPTHGQTVNTDKGQIVYAAAVVKAAEQNPRLLIDERGWKVTHVNGFSEDTGTIAFAKGDLDLEMNWYPADQHDGYYEDRLDVSKPETMTAAGQPGALFRYSANDFEILLEPDGSSFAAMRTGGNWKDKAAILAVFAKVKKVDVQTWLDALPPEIVTPGRADTVTNEITADIALPPGFDKTKYDNLGINDRYQFGVKVVDDVVCDWLTTWEQSATAGDKATVQQAVDALKDSRHWKILKEMDASGHYPDGIWQIADQVAPGQNPVRFREIMGCR